MRKNIVIYSDGTGQRSGVFFEEQRSNIYKLYRATRPGPDSVVDPSRQFAWYDPGIGTEPLRGNTFIRLFTRISNLVSQATGLGLAKNIIRCYSQLIRVWEPGDRIFLFGFSRGAYTVRCVASMLSLCGIPTAMPDGSALRKNRSVCLKIAREGVTRVYQHASYAPEDTEEIRKNVLHQRDLLAARFREKYQSADGNGKSNVAPHFIGVFDTVSSIARLDAIFMLTGVFALSIVPLGWLFSLPFGGDIFSLCILLLVIPLITAGLVLLRSIRIPGPLPGYSALQTMRFDQVVMAGDDMFLDERVMYVRHAISIDEDRKSFPRVAWGMKGMVNRQYENSRYQFEQYWFSGNHSDIGGGYDESESRLSDIALAWMLEAAVAAGLAHDPRHLHLYPNARAAQHDESRSLLFRLAGKSVRSIPPDAPLHPSVQERFRLDGVLHHDVKKTYRPEALKMHQAVRHFYE